MYPYFCELTRRSISNDSRLVGRPAEDDSFRILSFIAPSFPSPLHLCIARVCYFPLFSSRSSGSDSRGRVEPVEDVVLEILTIAITFFLRLIFGSDATQTMQIQVCQHL